jgi:hypothetical protein
MSTRPAILTQRYIFRFWLPLALMWLMMAVEQPFLAAVIARMDEPVHQLAAFGITFSLALLIESPIIMLLTASTALAKGKQSYGQLLRFTNLLSAAITAFHLVFVLTPAFHWLVGTVIGAPEALIELSRLSFLLMFPWTAAVAYRRLWQGVMIRFGKTDQVGLTMIARLVATGGVAVAGLIWHFLPGAALAGLALSAGVIAGAAAAYLWTRPILRGPLSQPEPASDRIDMRQLLDFYIPLALTNVINFIGRPLLTFGLSRSLLALESLALWPVLLSLAFLFRSVGFAYQEVVVALIDDEQSYLALRRFALLLGAATSALLILLAVTPLNALWYGSVSGLTPDLVALSGIPTLLIALTPAAAVIIAWQRGVLVYVRRTRLITVAVALNVTVLIIAMWLGMLFLPVVGVTIAAAAYMLAFLTESGFLATQTHRARKRLMIRDQRVSTVV